MDREFKTFSGVQFKAGAAGIVEAIPAVFNNVDAASERILPGAFADSLAERLPYVVLSHDWQTPIGKCLEAKELAPGDAALPDSLKQLGGLYVRFQCNMDTQAGRETFSNLQFGALDQFSIGYRVIRDSMDNETGVRDLQTLQLYEISPVLVGCNPATALLSAKGAPHAGAQTLADHSQSVLAAVSEFHTRIRDLAELRARDGRELSSANRDRIAAHCEELTALTDDLRALLKTPDDSLQSAALAALATFRATEARLAGVSIN